MVTANEDWRNDDTAALFAAIVSLDNRDEAAHFELIAPQFEHENDAVFAIPLS